MKMDITLPDQLHGFVAGIAAPLEFGRQRLKEAISGLTAAELTATGGFSNSIATLVVHIAATEASLAFRVTGETMPDSVKADLLLDRPRGATLPAAHGETVETLYTKLDTSRAMLLGALARIADADLTREVPFGPDRTATVRWALALLPQHQGQHFGQIQMIRKAVG